MILTSESVTPGHPDKLCDQISDAILDAHLREDPNARVAAETLASAHGITVAGEITSQAQNVNVEQLVRDTVRSIGYTAESGLDPDTLMVQNQLTSQSPEISGAVHQKTLGAGDQGMMFGYATRETPELMPTPLVLAREMTWRLTALRETKQCPWLRPDGKAQVSVEYEGNRPVKVAGIVVSTQHSPMSFDEVKDALLNRVVEPVLEQYGFEMESKMSLHLNPAGPWNIGGPVADSGLTGRKIIVDTYGGAARHGGGAFSGKDATKVDRSAAYAAREAARWLVLTGHADKAEVQLSYAIGVPEPVSISVWADGSSKDSRNLAKFLRDMFDFTPQGIIDRLRLLQPIYERTARFGHFGHSAFSWEK